MPEVPQPRLVRLDGRTGEGGGQLVRIAAGLSALTGTPISIHHVRGNRPGKRGGGLKTQHMLAIKYLATATDADVANCFVGSSSFDFTPRRGPGQLIDRNINIDAESAASVLLIFQSILPFLLYADDTTGSAINLTIKGGTNVTFSLSYDYLDQVLLPSLELMGVPHIERSIIGRGWTHGTKQLGSVTFKITPLKLGHSLNPRWPSFTDPGSVKEIRLTLVVPQVLISPLEEAIKTTIGLKLPGVACRTHLLEDSGHPARIYAMLVAHTEHGFRLGRDRLYMGGVKNRSSDAIIAFISQRIVESLIEEIEQGGVVDEFLQDQLIIFQALAHGRTTISGLKTENLGDRRDRNTDPFGQGSMHAQTARWVVSELLPEVKFFDNGQACDGIGWTAKAEGLVA